MSAMSHCRTTSSPWLRRQGQEPGTALAKAGSGPWCYDIRVRGANRVETATALESAIQRLGYEADVQYSP